MLLPRAPDAGKMAMFCIVLRRVRVVDWVACCLYGAGVEICMDGMAELYGILFGSLTKLHDGSLSPQMITQAQESHKLCCRLVLIS